MEKIARNTLITALIVSVAILYVSFGYLIAYSFDGSVQQTITSNIIYHTINFANFGPSRGNMDIGTYFMFMMAWPLFLLVFWIGNFFYLIYFIFLWIFTGGLLKLLGLI